MPNSLYKPITNNIVNRIARGISNHTLKNLYVENERKRPRNLVEYHMRSQQTVVSNVIETPGDEMMRMIDMYINKMPDDLKRNEQQMIMHEAILRSVSHAFFPKDFAVQSVRIMRERNWSRMGKMCLISCPRRWGKTVAVSQFLAAYMMTVPNCRILVFSTNGRISNSLMDHVKQFLVYLLGTEVAKNKIRIEKDEKLTFSYGVYDKRTLWALPSGKTIWFDYS